MSWFQRWFGGVEPEFDKPSNAPVGIEPRVEKVSVAMTPCHQLTVDAVHADLFGEALDVLVDGFNKKQLYRYSSMVEKYRNQNCPAKEK